MNRHKTVMCNVCGNVMRDDTIKRHMSTKHGNEGHHQSQRQATLDSDTPAEDVCQDRSFASDATEVCNQHYQATAAILTSVQQPMKTADNVNASLEYELVRDNETYTKKLEIGGQVSVILLSGKIMEKSLSKHNKFCLELFRACQPTLDVANAELRLWQEQLLDIINEDEMNDRKIIWVKGEKGDEGKSWFQSYVQSLHGAHRVARFDITNKTADLLHIMTRCSLATTDIFLFNQQRCISSEDCCYSLLEMIKDGYASSPKFHGTLLRIKTPNVVVVFSNHDPIVCALSKDRWKILFITKNGLTVNHEERLWSVKKDDKTPSTGHFKNTRLFPRIKNTPHSLGSNLST